MLLYSLQFWIRWINKTCCVKFLWNTGSKFSSSCLGSWIGFAGLLPGSFCPSHVWLVCLSNSMSVLGPTNYGNDRSHPNRWGEGVGVASSQFLAWHQARGSAGGLARRQPASHLAGALPVGEARTLVWLRELWSEHILRTFGDRQTVWQLQSLTVRHSECSKVWQWHYIILNNRILKLLTSVFPRSEGYISQYTP